METKKRSFVKSLTWRIFAALLLGFTTFLFIGDLATASVLTLIYQGIQLAMFYMHERLWTHVSWGLTSGLLIQMTGMSGSGKTTIGKEVKRRLEKKGFKVELIDGDEYREGLCKDLGFSKKDRNTNIRRLGFVGRKLAQNGVITIISAINPYEKIRRELRYADPNTKTVYVKCDLETLVDRDPKGLYEKALLPEGHPNRINNFTGVSDPFDPPKVCDLTLNTAEESVKQSATKLEAFILENV